MACVFIVSIPKANQEFSYNNDTSKCVFEKENIVNASKLINELKEHKKFGSRSMELCMEDTCLSKSKSTECLNLSSSGLYKSKSSININEDRLTGQCMKTTWEEIKQAIQPKAKKKLKITGLGSCMDVTEANWNKPIETILSNIIANLGISNSSWSPTKNSTCWQVIFTVESRTLCEELLQVFKEFGIGSRNQSSVSVLPCALHYASSATQREFSRTVEMRSEISEQDHDWSCFSSSPSRPNLRQMVRDIQDEAALTLNWLCLLLAAAFLATLGLVENSSVTIVASMLVSPLAAPIIASTLGTVVRVRYLQRTGLMHSILGLFLCVVTGFITGLVVCVLNERYGIIGDWPSSEMITRCELRSIWVGILVALPSGACMTLGLFGQSTNTLAGVVISASLLPPAVNAGLLWAMALDRLLSSNDNDLARSVLNPGALAILGTVSLSLTLINTLAVFLAGVAVHKVKQVCPFEQKNISWRRRNAKLIELPTDNMNERTIDENSISGLNDKQCTEEPDLRPEKAVAPALGIPGLVHSDTITYRRNGFHRLRAHNIEAYCLRQPPFDEQHTPPDSQKSMESDLSNRELSAKIIAPDTNDMKNKSFENNDGYCDKMPAGVVFVVCIPSSNYEHVLRFGKPKDIIIPIDDNPFKSHMTVELRSKKSRSIPVHLTQNYYNEGFNPKLVNISEAEFFTMESILQELLVKLEVEHVVWVSDKQGNYFEVTFPLPTGDRCETMLHCLTQLGIGVRWKSIVSVLPCNVVHSAITIEQHADEDTILRQTEEARRWRSFVESIRSKLTVKQVVDGVRGGGELSFDYLTLIVTADSLAALGLVENNASNIVAAMLVSPLMGPVMSITFGTVIADRSLVRSGVESLVLGMLVSLLFGFIFGLILGSTSMPWGYGDWPTEEMKSRGNVRSLWMGVLWALTSGTGVALALLQGSAGPLIGIAISASLLPPVVNCGLFWALACIWLLYPGVKIPHIKGESYSGNSTYVPLYHDYMPIEFAVNGIVSCCLTLVNVICIFITAIIFLKIKEVAAPYTSSPDLRRFWEQDIKVAREANRTNLQRAENDERTELVLDDVNQASEEEVKEKLEAAVEEALNDETYRKVKRMSYQSHNADEVFRTIGLQTRNPVSLISSRINSGAATPRSRPRESNVPDIATLDKLLTSLLALKDRRSRSFRSHQTSHDRGTDFRRPESWPERIFENSIVRNVINNLKASKRNSPIEEPFLTPQ